MSEDSKTPAWRKWLVHVAVILVIILLVGLLRPAVEMRREGASTVGVPPASIKN